MQQAYLKLREAAHYSGIGQKRLKRLADAGVIKGVKDPDDGRHAWPDVGSNLRWLGHSDIRTTQIYAEIYDAVVATEMAKLKF